MYIVMGVSQKAAVRVQGQKADFDQGRRSMELSLPMGPQLSDSLQGLTQFRLYLILN